VEQAMEAQKFERCQGSYIFPDNQLTDGDKAGRIRLTEKSDDLIRN
jgi:hypothetical protein